MNPYSVDAYAVIEFAITCVLTSPFFIWLAFRWDKAMEDARTDSTGEE